MDVSDPAVGALGYYLGVNHPITAAQAVCSYAAATASITIDGSIADWVSVTSQINATQFASPFAGLQHVKLARNGGNLYFLISDSSVSFSTAYGISFAKTSGSNPITDGVFWTTPASAGATTACSGTGAVNAQSTSMEGQIPIATCLPNTSGTNSAVRLSVSKASVGTGCQGSITW